jgi:hypothetical protein
MTEVEGEEASIKETSVLGLSRGIDVMKGVIPSFVLKVQSMVSASKEGLIRRRRKELHCRYRCFVLNENEEAFGSWSPR